MARKFRILSIIKYAQKINADRDSDKIEISFSERNLPFVRSLSLDELLRTPSILSPQGFHNNFIYTLYIYLHTLYLHTYIHTYIHLHTLYIIH